MNLYSYNFMYFSRTPESATLHQRRKAKRLHCPKDTGRRRICVVQRRQVTKQENLGGICRRTRA